VRVGGNITPPTKTKNVLPIYPASAAAEGRRGVAIIEAVIGTNGTVTNAMVVRSIGDDLDAAALDAVRQWEFTPTTLNGVAVPVIMTVTVNFSPAGGVPPPPPPLPMRADAPPPPPPPPVPTWAPGDSPLRIGGNVKAPVKTKNVAPVYPQDARDANVSGVVIIEARIDQNGRVSDARVIRPVALLDQAALDAVYQWEFEPTLINGQPVPVIMTVTVNFTVK